ncbi:MAG: N-acetyltransferase [Fimbriimonadaceae bacterium]|nr:N-acetyltransferase [Alphaproteobacteria bacterium]
MTNTPYSIKPERPNDAAIIEELNALAFGPGRFTLTAYRVREMAAKIESLCFTAWFQGDCIGSIRHSLVTCGAQQGLMLGPLVVHPDHKNRGCGMALIGHAMSEAAKRGYKWAILVGDYPYYRRAGFHQVTPGQITFPGPVDPARILLRDLRPANSDEPGGMIQPLNDAP